MTNGLSHNAAPTAAQLAELWARQVIADKFAQYCRGVDRGDEALLLSVFWPEATVDHPPFVGSASDFCRAALDFIKIVDVSMHEVSNILVEFDGEMAYAEAHFVGYHRLAKHLQLEGPIAEVVGAFHRNDIDEDHFVGGRYIKWFERRGEEWKVIHHIGFREWERWSEAAERYPIPGLGRRDRLDPSYRRKDDRATD